MSESPELQFGPWSDTESSEDDSGPSCQCPAPPEPPLYNAWFYSSTEDSPRDYSGYPVMVQTV